MLPPLELFGKPISIYLIMAVLGGLAVALFVYLTARGPQYRRDQWLHIFLSAGAGAFIGAHLLYFITRMPAVVELITHWDHYISSWEDAWSAFQLLAGGMVYYGGLFGALVGGYLYCRALKIDFGLHLDAVVPAIPLFHTFGRIGCLLGGCCYGVESEYGWFFPYSPLADPHVRYFPIQLVEAGLNFLLFWVLLLLPKVRIPKGKLLWIYFPAYGVMRFILEFWRGDEVRGIYFGLSTSQWISLLLVVLSVIVWLREWRRAPVAEKTSLPTNQTGSPV